MEGNLEREIELLEVAVTAGRRDRVALHVVRSKFLGGDPADGTSPGSTIRWLHRRHAPLRQSRPRAFLASFTTAKHIECIPIFEGLTRVGRNPLFSDLADLPRGEPCLEGRQWILLCANADVWIADDRSTNQSLVVPDAAQAPDVDARRDTSAYAYGKVLEVRWSEKSSLDWAGEQVHRLAEGDVVFAAYAGWVFGRVPPDARWPTRS